MLEVAGQHAHRLARANGSFTSKLAAALEADKRSDEIMAKIQQVERASRETRSRVSRLDGKFAWTTALGNLLRDQSSLEGDLSSWARARTTDADIECVAPADTSDAEPPADTERALSESDDADLAGDAPTDPLSLHAILRDGAAAERQGKELMDSLRHRIAAARRDAATVLAPLLRVPAAAGDDASGGSLAAQLSAHQRRRALELQASVGRLAEEAWEVGQELALEEAAASVAASAAQARVFAALSAAAPASSTAPSPAAGSGAGLVAALESLARAAGCADANLRVELLDGAVRLQRRYDGDLDALDAAWAKQCAVWGVADPADDRGGWLEDAHRAYTHAVALHAHSRRGEGGGAAAAASSSALQGALALINAAAPASPVTLDELQRHHAWFGARKHAINRRAARVTQGSREREEFLASARSRLEAAAAAEREAAARAAAAAEQERRTHALHQRLERERAAAQLAAAVEAQVLADLAAAESAVAGARAAAARERALAQKAALELYHRENAAVAAGRERVAAAQAALSAEAAAEAREHNSERVSFRRQRLEERRARGAALAAQAAALDAQHAELVARLAAAVPYRERLDDIAAFSDPERVVAHTAASRAAAEMSQAYAAFLQYAQAPPPQQQQQHQMAAGVPRPPLPPRPPSSMGGSDVGASAGGALSARSVSLGGGGRASSASSRRRLVDPHAPAVPALPHQPPQQPSQQPQRGTSHGAVDLVAAAMAARLGAGGAGGGSGGSGGGGGSTARSGRSSSVSGRRTSATGGPQPPPGPPLSVAGGGGDGGAGGWSAALLRLAEDRAREQGLFGRAGFSDAQVTADPRFRLNAALRAGGLGGNAYARQMMAQAGEGLRGAVAAQRQAGSFAFG